VNVAILSLRKITQQMLRDLSASSALCNFICIVVHLCASQTLGSQWITNGGDLDKYLAHILLVYRDVMQFNQ